MNIEFIDSNQKIVYEVYPTISHESFCNYLDFPEPNFEPDLSMITHRIRIIASLDLFIEEYNVTEEIKDQLKQQYKLNEEENSIEIAKVTITEFPNEWKEHMEVTWFYWLDALDGDHAVIGSRADEILDRELYEDPFDLGSLFYVQSLKVHPLFRGNKLGIKLIEYAFKYLIRTSNGMIFVIAEEPITSVFKEQSSANKSTGLVRYYEKSGFTRAFNSINKDLVMEIELRKIRDWG